MIVEREAKRERATHKTKKPPTTKKERQEGFWGLCGVVWAFSDEREKEERGGQKRGGMKKRETREISLWVRERKREEKGKRGDPKESVWCDCGCGSV